jgi:hypothetical protein
VKTRTAVIALSIGAVIAAIVVVAANWPQLPERTMPEPMRVVPMAGDTVGAKPVGCLAPVIAELRKRPSWVLRIDDRRWTDATSGDDDPKHGEIVIDETGATWQSSLVRSQTLPLTDEETREAIAAFDLGCERDESKKQPGYEGRYIGVAYSRTAKAVATIPHTSPAEQRLGALFEQLRTRYVTNRAGAAQTYLIELSGQRRDGDVYRKFTWKYDAAKSDDSVSQKVDLLDWAFAQPATRPKTKKTAHGTLTLEGVTKPIAISLDWNSEENQFMHRFGPYSELTIWMSINHDGGE